ncbi:hypothetical protein A7982_13736 [Minicystis rosea]|nr:hypothetical protein A7982_13736 [Minicystis rosea]
MRTRRAHAEMQTPLVLRAPGGEPVPVTAPSLAYDSRAGAVVEARLTFLVSAERYREVDARALFHLARDARGPGAERFEPEGDVQIEARLGATLLPALVALGDTPERAAEAFIHLNGEQPNHALFATESWYALHVTREEILPRGALRTGYGTTWTAPESDTP